MKNAHTIYDAIVVGAGVSGSFIASDLAQEGLSCLLLEAGKFFNKHTYLSKEIDSNSQMYWGGGIEFNTSANLGILRPKVVGGGSIVNQALLDRFDDLALDSWKEVSGISFFTRESLDPYYDQAEAELNIQTIPEEFRNGNALIFKEGFEKNHFNWAPLKRAQKDCQYQEGNDCIECLSGCPIDSKQSTPVTVLRKGQEKGLEIVSEFDVQQISHTQGEVHLHGINSMKERQSFHAKRLVLGAGAIGNAKLLLNSGFKKQLPALGKNFFSHPQFMVLGLYGKTINSHKGPLQSLKSDDPNFRRKGFKLENVFAPPVAISMLIPGIGEKHQYYMRNISRLACIEVAIRDTHPGEIKINRKGEHKVIKKLNDEDKNRRNRGLEAIQNIFQSTGAREIIRGKIPIGLHLMGACAIGLDPQSSVVDPKFRLHGYKNIWIADSSIFPNAPGINPSLTIMALSKMAAKFILKE